MCLQGKEEEVFLRTTSPLLNHHNLWYLRKHPSLINLKALRETCLFKENSILNDMIRVNF